MSFAYRIKSEICNNRPFRQRRRWALAYGLLLFGRAFGPEEISLHTEHKFVARLYADSISDLVGLGGSITLREVKRKDRRSVYLVTVDSLSDRVAVLSRFGCRAGEDPRRVDFAHVPEEEAAAFLSGAFLACGAVSDPEKGYRVEFATQHQPGSRTTLRRCSRNISRRPSGRCAATTTCSTTRRAKTSRTC